MKRTILLMSLLIPLSLSCSQSDAPVHSSYVALNDFLKQEKLYKTLGIEKVNVDFVSIIDTKDFRPDNTSLRSRTLEATYDFTITARNRVYQSKASVTSTDSLIWRMKTLVLKAKTDSSNTVVEKTYTWDLSKDPIKRGLTTTMVTKS